MMTCNLILKNLSIYWRTLFMMIYPLVLLPIFLLDNTAAMRCIYVVALTTGFWIFEVLPLAITSMIPQVLFPLMGVLNSRTAAMAYFKESNTMFLGGLIVTFAVEFCNLHTRISLHIIKLIGCSYRRLNLTLVTVTMFVSMWISNTAATVMMLPIIKAILQELEKQGLARIWRPGEENLRDTDRFARHPTRMAMCFYLTIAFASTIGGVGCIVGNDTNLVLKVIYHKEFRDSPGVEFDKWLLVSVPLMFAIMIPTWFWMQFWFMGLWRPNCPDARAIYVSRKDQVVIKQILTKKLQEMGGLSYHETLVGMMYVLAIVLWVLRKPNYIPGWPDFFTDDSVSDCTTAAIVVILLFFLPARPDFIHMFDDDESKRPTEPSTGLITWQYVHEHMYWNLIFLMGGSLVLVDGTVQSGLDDMIVNQISRFIHLPRMSILVLSTLIAMATTQVTNDVEIATVLLPSVANVARKAKIHPLYLMMPFSLGCSFSFLLPVSSAPNAVATAPCNMRPLEMIKAASVVILISFVMLIIILPLLGNVIWDFSQFPEWAQE